MGSLSLAHIITALVWIGLYFTPTFVARSRQHRNAVAITALNVLTGRTVLGWIAAFVWALTAVEKEKQP